MQYVYFDNNATSRLDPEVFDAMLPYLSGEHYGNPSNSHSYGKVAWRAVESAREQIAHSLQADKDEVYFTASGTEANNTIIKGVVKMSTRTNLLVGATEHPCVLCAARSLQGGEINYVPLSVNSDGLIDASDLDSLLDKNCVLLSVMLANNETGVIQDVRALAQKARAHGAWMHTDAAQAVGKIPVSFKDLQVDAMTISGHKIYGPKGVAALIKRAHLPCAPLLDGGGQEREFRSGTENVAGIVGLAKACELAVARQEQFANLTSTLSEQLRQTLYDMSAIVFADNEQVPRLANTNYFGFTGIDGDALVVTLDQMGFATSSGAACSSMKGFSHVLQAMGYTSDIARSAVRVSFGRYNTEAQLVSFLQALRQAVDYLRSLQALAE